MVLFMSKLMIGSILIVPKAKQVRKILLRLTTILKIVSESCLKFMKPPGIRFLLLNHS